MYTLYEGDNTLWWPLSVLNASEDQWRIRFTRNGVFDWEKTVMINNADLGVIGRYFVVYLHCCADILCEDLMDSEIFLERSEYNIELETSVDGVVWQSANLAIVSYRGDGVGYQSEYVEYNG